MQLNSIYISISNLNKCGIFLSVDEFVQANSF
jgi:hypothetical protein